MPGDKKLKCAECTHQGKPCVSLSWASLDTSRDNLREDLVVDEAEWDALLERLSEVQASVARSERFLSRLKATPERSCTAWSRRWRLRVRICRRRSSTHWLCRPSSSVLLLSTLLQQELAVRKVLEWFPGIFQVWVIFPLNKVLLTLFLQDSFDFEFLFFL